ncbi:V-set and transmembrane domain-containing protein 4 isoform 2-T2 [Mantella aurantiaca]
MTLCILMSAFFSQTLIAGLCYALNVTVYPSPWALYPLGGNASIWCSVSQKRKLDSLLTVRWVFSPGSEYEKTIGRITKYGNKHISANWSKKIELSNESSGQIYQLILTYLHPSDEGLYICRVQEVAQYRNHWSAVSNGTASTQLKVTALTMPEEKQLLSWTLFQDLYLYGVLLCSLGILSLLTFFIILLCQTVMKRQHCKEKWKCSHKRHCDKYLATDMMLPIPPKKKKKMKTDGEEIPPIIPIKGPLINLDKKSKKPLQLPHIARLREDGLAYAELELINLTTTKKDPTSGTVYAQIQFEENILKQQMEIAGQKILCLRPLDEYIK